MYGSAMVSTPISTELKDGTRKRTRYCHCGDYKGKGATVGKAIENR